MLYFTVKNASMNDLRQKRFH